MNAVSLVLAMCCSLMAQDSGARPGGIVATVGDDPITQGQLDKRVMRELNRPGSLPRQSLKYQKPELSRRILNDMIDELLLLQEAARVIGGANGESGNAGQKGHGGGVWARVKNQVVSEREIDLVIEERIAELDKNNFKIPSPEHFYDHVEQTLGLNREELREEIRRERAIQKLLINHVFRPIDRFVPPVESRYYYRTHLDEFTNPVEVSFRQIFLHPDRRYAPEAIQIIDRRLEDIRKIEDLADREAAFLELARKFSQESDLPEQRGRLWEKSFEELKSWVYPIAAKLRALGKGEITRSFLSQRGWHYLFLVDLVEGNPKSYEEAQQSIEEKIQLTRRELAYKRFLQKLRAKTVITLSLPGEPDADGKEDAKGSEAAEAPAGAKPDRPPGS